MDDREHQTSRRWFVPVAAGEMENVENIHSNRPSTYTLDRGLCLTHPVQWMWEPIFKQTTWDKHSDKSSTCYDDTSNIPYSDAYPSTGHWSRLDDVSP
jgi:hypothetical protein